jgi:hypothetical protein
MKAIIPLILCCTLQSLALPQATPSREAKSKDTELSALVDSILVKRKISNDLVQKYSWTSKTEILKSKKTLNLMVEKNQYDHEGKVVKKVLNQVNAKMPKTFLIKGIAKSEKENLEKFLYGLRDFLKEYSLRRNEELKQFIETASWQVADSTHEFVFTGKNVVEDGDQMIWMVDHINYSTCRLEIFTTFEGEAVHFTGTFMRLKNGMNYLTHAEALIPSKKITLRVRNYDYAME